MTKTIPDRFSAARSVADAVLYEGYVLYPYRASSRKNQVRFQWGVLTPQAFSEQEGSERWSARTECVVEAQDAPLLSVRIRFLHAQHRSVEAYKDGGFVPVDSLQVGGTLHVAWDEAVDRVVDIGPLWLRTLEGSDHDEPFAFEGGTQSEVLSGEPEGEPVGRFVRHREPIRGDAHLEVARSDPTSRYLNIGVTVVNSTPWHGASRHRDDAIGHSLVAVHVMLAVDGGRFVSLLDPPPEAVDAAAACRSNGLYPVLIGEDDVVLASPIILYDHPEVAPESPGDLYDSLEIDEILALRVMTLTDEEKSEARGTDARAAAIIDRCDGLSPETMSRLHGQLRPVEQRGTPDREDEEPAPWWDPTVDASFDPWTESVWVSGVEITKGSAVRLQPSHRADAHDIFLAGMTATVAGVFTDVDGDRHVAVTVDDDPATQELLWQGRFLFFHPDEVQPLAERQEAP